MFGLERLQMDVVEDQIYQAEQVAVAEQFDQDMMQQDVMEQIDYGQVRAEEVVDYGYQPQQLAYDNFAVGQDQILREQAQQQQFLREEEVVNNFETPYYMPQDRRDQWRDQRIEERNIRREQRFDDRQERRFDREQMREDRQIERQQDRQDRRFERQQQRQDRRFDRQEEREQKDIWRDESRNDREVNREQRREQRQVDRFDRREQREMNREERRDERWQQRQERREEIVQRNYLQVENRENQAYMMQEQQFDRFGNAQIPPKMEITNIGDAINSTDKLQSPIYYHHFFEWKQGVGCISNGQVAIGDKSVRLPDLGKVKIAKELATNNSRRLKLSHLTGDALFSVQCDLTLNGLPLHYLWFARVITEKLYLKGCDLSNPYVPQRRFVNSHIKSPSIDGIIYKQSQYLKSWELRYVAITQEGLFSFKDETGGESFAIKRDSANELWTRFDIHERMLVIKVHHSSRKTEFGIPIVDYCRESSINWLYHFYRLLFPL